MLKPKKIVWEVTFQGCDRGELFTSLRGQQERFREDVIDNMSPLDDHDQDNISASISVENLDELVSLLNATANVRCYHGRGVAVRSEFSSMSHYASLFASDGQYARSSASVSANVVPQTQVALLEKISAAEMALSEVRDEVRAIGAQKE